MYRLLLALSIAISAMLAIPASPANAASTWYGNSALNWAESHAYGCWYSYGGSSCSPGYDCSGLVMKAFSNSTAHITLPHNTVSMVRSGRLHRISSAVRGALVIFGNPSAPYHVEFATNWWHTTYGAHSSGKRSGWEYRGNNWDGSQVSFWLVY